MLQDHLAAPLMTHYAVVNELRLLLFAVMLYRYLYQWRYSCVCVIRADGTLPSNRLRLCARD
ncbi:MAG: hypothetical protein WC100_01440 [Sterolibacterium sp.]